MRNPKSFVNYIFSLLLVVGIFLSLGAPQAAIAQDGQPTVSSGPQDKAKLVDPTIGMEPPPVPPASDEGTPELAPPPDASTDASSETSAALMSSMLILDDFNRANGSIGSNWTVRNGFCNISSNAAVCGTTGLATFNNAPGDGNTAEADVAAVGTTLQFTGLVLNYGAGVTNLFLKVQQDDASGKFNRAACYTGNNNSSATFGLGFFALTAPFSTAHMQATRIGSTVTIVFSNIDYGSQPDQIYNCSGAPAPEGSGIGIAGYDGSARLDNFAVHKVVDTLLWDQPLSSDVTSTYVNQEFPDTTSASSYLADDFIADNTWRIDSIFVPGNGWNGFTTLMNATALNWKIYADNGAIPAGNPSGGGSSPVWSMTLSPTDPQITISTGPDDYPSDTLLKLTSPFTLPPGHYWLVFYPTMTFGAGGQFGRQAADTTNDNDGQFINPGGGFGLGTAWQNWSVLDPILAEHDIAFRIGGAVTEGEWKSINPINGNGRSRPAAAGVDGKIYVIGGEQPTAGFANTVEEYDPSTGEWITQAGLMPTPASNVCAAAIGTDIYIPGGYNGASINTLQVYHTTTDTWTTVTTDPVPNTVHGSGCAALSGKLYVFGGVSSITYLNSAYVYDPAAAAGARWTVLPSMTYARGYLAGVAVNGKVYAVGGREAITSDFAYVEAYNPADGSWHTVTNMKIARGGPGSFSRGNTLVVCGGGWASYYNTCELYDTTNGYAGSWTYMSSMINGRRTFAYAKLGPSLYAVAGFNGTYLTSAERWSIESFIPVVMNKPFTTLGFNSQFNGSAPGWGSIAGIWALGANDIFTSGDAGLWSSVAYNGYFTDLDYQARMIRYGNDTNSNQLIIRGTPTPLDPARQWYSEYIFQYTRNGNFSVWKVVAGGAPIALQSWTPTGAINIGDAYNTLRVIASGSKFYYYINGTLVWQGADTSLTSGRAGIGMFRPLTGTGDQLRVDWATLWTYNIALVTDKVSPEQQLLNDAANMNRGGEVSTAP